MKYSIIVLLEKDEIHPGSRQYIQDLYDLFLERQEPFELMIAVNGSGFFVAELEQLLLANKNLKAILFGFKTTQAVCINSMISESSGEIIVVCGSYRQISDDSFTRMLDAIDDGTDIVTPWRQNRIDGKINQLESKLFNSLVRSLTGTDSHDLSCTVKIFRKKVAENVDIYGSMYRFLPILADKKGLKSKEIKCDHFQKIGAGKSGIYSLQHYSSIFIDILTLYFNTRFSKKPLRFFSTIGMIFFLAGMFITFYIFLERFLFNYPIGSRILLLLSLLLMVLGIQAASVGLLGEIIAFIHGRHRNEYSIDKIL